MKLLFLVLAMAALIYVAYVAIGGATGHTDPTATQGPAATMHRAQESARQIEGALQDEEKRIDDTTK